MDIDLAIIMLAVSLVGMLGGIITRDRQVMKMIHDGDEKNAVELKIAENSLHTRINGTKDSFGRELDSLKDTNRSFSCEIGRLEGCFEGVKAEMVSINKKLDLLLNHHLKNDE